VKILIFFITSGIAKTSSNPFETKLVPIESSFGHKDLGLVVEDPLDPQIYLWPVLLVHPFPHRWLRGR
jgi:hypothetical protein